MMDEKNYFGNQVGNPTLDPGPSDALGGLSPLAGGPRLRGRAGRFAPGAGPAASAHTIGWALAGKFLGF